MPITHDNWNYCFYQNGPLKAYISLCAQLNGDDVTESYNVIVTNTTSQMDVFQQEFQDLDATLKKINSHYSHWTYMDPTNPSEKEGGSCSNCSAH